MFCSVFLAPCQGFTFSGICRVTCIYGQVEIYGHIVKQGQPARDVFSAYTHSYLTIGGVRYSEPEKSEKEMRRELRALLRPHMKLGNWLQPPAQGGAFQVLVTFWSPYSVESSQRS